MARSSKDDAVLASAKKKLGEAITAVDTKAAGGVADLVKLVEALTGLKEVELKADEGTFGSGLSPGGQD